MKTKNVIIIGGGLAGLACACQLQKRNINFLLLEAEDTLGGRVKTDSFQGFLLDRGFQVLQTNYPELHNFIDLNQLKLRYFRAGAIIWTGRKFIKIVDPLSDWKGGLSTAFSRVGSFRDKIKILQLRRQLQKKSLTEILSCFSDRKTIDYLKDYGFSDRILKFFFIPFLRGVFLEEELSTSHKKFEFVFKMFSEGQAGLPEQGMKFLVDKFVQNIPSEKIQLNSKVIRIDKNEVFLEHESLEGDYIVLAVDAEEAARLIGRESDTTYHSVTCLYYQALSAPIPGPFLILNGAGRTSINNICFPTEINKSYAPPGSTLVSVTLLGVPDLTDNELEYMVYSDLRDWFGSRVDEWELLKMYRIKKAIPRQDKIDFSHLESSPYILCGDYLDIASINGALASGRRAAEKIISND